MKLPINKQCDVFVIGAGLAGIRASIEITGCHVILCSSTHIFSGSSFYPGTWGLGLVGPKDNNDKENLKEAIHHVGCFMCDKKLVNTFVNHINEGIDEIKDMGVQLKQAVDQTQKEFIPCFDNNQRNWNGLLFDSLKETFTHKIKEKDIELLDYHEVIDIILNKDKEVCGVVVCDQNNQLNYIACRSVVIASGGIGGLYKYRLNTHDICGMGQYLALKSGASLVNMEFIQMMLGFISPSPKTIYNEKMFKYTKFYHNDKQIFTDQKDSDLLNIRSTHGPFTSRLPSKKIDIQLFKYFVEDNKSLFAKHDPSLKETNIEFIKTYFQWLKDEKKIDINQDIQLGIFAHAANGGIQIDENGATQVKGMYVCGEATGGMHGADRIGGLSSANGLVFGKRVGQSVQAYLKSHYPIGKETIDFEEKRIKNAKELLNKIQELMSAHAMIIRNEENLSLAYNQICQIEDSIEYIDNGKYSETYQLLSAITLSKVILKACLLRKESRGSHYRSDYPLEDKKYQKRICIKGYRENNIYFESEE